MVFSVGKLYDLLKRSIRFMEISQRFIMQSNFLVDHKSQNLSTLPSAQKITIGKLSLNIPEKKLFYVESLDALNPYFDEHLSTVISNGYHGLTMFFLLLKTFEWKESTKGRYQDIFCVIELLNQKNWRTPFMLYNQVQYVLELYLIIVDGQCLW